MGHTTGMRLDRVGSQRLRLADYIQVGDPDTPETAVYLRLQIVGLEADASSETLAVAALTEDDAVSLVHAIWRALGYPGPYADPLTNPGQARMLSDLRNSLERHA